MHSRVPAPRAVAAPGVLDLVPPLGRSERLPPRGTGVVVVGSPAPLRLTVLLTRWRIDVHEIKNLWAGQNNFSF